MRSKDVIDVFRASANVGERDGSGVLRQNGAWCCDAIQLFEDLELQVGAFRRSLDDHRRIRARVERRGRRDSTECRIASGSIDRSLLHLAFEVCRDCAAAFFERSLGDIDYRNRITAQGSHMGDAPAHLSGADHRDLFTHARASPSERRPNGRRMTYNMATASPTAAKIPPSGPHAPPVAQSGPASISR